MYQTIADETGLSRKQVGAVFDAFTNLIKRDLGKKDAASLLPGFGGLVDLTDSVVYAGPIAYLFWLLLPLFNSPAAG